MIGSMNTRTRTVSGLIELKFDVVVEETVPAGIYLSVQEFAEKFGMNESTLRTQLSRGTIPSFLFFGKRLIPADFEPDNKSDFKSEI